MKDEQLRHALKTALSCADFPAARQREVMKIIKGEQTMKTRKLSLALICALLLTLLTAGVALAAALGVFGTLAQDQENLYSSNRLHKLEEASEPIQTRSVLSAPQAQQPSPAPKTVYDMLLSRQYERSFDLTVHQAYCDGNKLYYSYTLQTNDARFFQGEGTPDGIDEWLMEQPGKRYQEVWSHSDPEADQTIIQWLDSHDSSWIARETWALGDGASLPNGTVCDILDSGEQMLDPCTLQGFQEVRLPDAFSNADSVTVELSVLYGTALYYQDETGVYWTHIAQPENRGILRIPVTVRCSGSPEALAGEGVFERYSAHADMLISDVDLSGKVTFSCYEKGLTQADASETGNRLPLSYVLEADGNVYPNLDGSLLISDSGERQLFLRFDLPPSVERLVLLPVYSSGECPQEALVLRP